MGKNALDKMMRNSLTGAKSNTKIKIIELFGTNQFIEK